MCIRDRESTYFYGSSTERRQNIEAASSRFHGVLVAPGETCLLYTSDAADERSSVDLGGRRIIKKKHNDNI